VITSLKKNVFKVVTTGGPRVSSLAIEKKLGRKNIKCLLREDGMGGLVRT
jgi:hypothetical protein